MPRSRIAPRAEKSQKVARYFLCIYTAEIYDPNKSSPRHFPLVGSTPRRGQEPAAAWSRLSEHPHLRVYRKYLNTLHARGCCDTYGEAR